MYFRIAAYWIGLIALAIVFSRLSLWYIFLSAFGYGFIMAAFGFYAFPFQYRKDTIQ